MAPNGFPADNVFAPDAPVLDDLTNDTVIFLDWDDTLLASTWVGKLGLRPKYVNEKPIIPDDVKSQLEELEDCVVELLESAVKYGRVVIITAAETGWVELSASLFMPRCLPIISEHIKVVSARSTYEDLYPGSPKKWKIEAFQHEVYYCDSVADNSSPPKHIISIGDGPTEREALINLKMSSSGRSPFHAKSLKLITYPNAIELKMEVRLLLDNLHTLCTHEEDMDLQISKEAIAAQSA
ncbi:hypothetical protein H310_03219 [Aphanomyces invadans]|nr:hypothetical protein H310_03219 [Aphanomyces invadans]ETW05456.1 hypothetical protein H310_03219 [Aphanomyces invadans]|eukprot:XP_008865233.1 hypothetical protein H310_03219 [Aphanomyces invadans]